jgi:hypothetical protein
MRPLIANAQLSKMGALTEEYYITTPRDVPSIMLFWLKREGITINHVLLAVVINKVIPGRLVDRWLNWRRDKSKQQKKNQN